MRCSRIGAAALFAITSLALATPAAADGLTVGPGATVDLGIGRLDIGDGDLDVAGNFSAGTQGFDARHVAIQATGLLSGDSALIQVCGDWTNAGTFNAGTSTVAFVDGCGTTSSTLTGANSFHDLSLTTSSGKQVNFAAGVTQTVTGTLTLAGSPGNLLVLRSTVDGSEAFLDLDAPASGESVDVQDLHAIDQPVTLNPNSVISGNAPGWSVFVPLVILDQVHVPPSSGASGVDFGKAQTFTVGVSGILDSIDVDMNVNPGDGTLQILTTSGGVPTSTVLTSAPIPAGPSGFVTVDLRAAAIPVTAGDVLAFAVLEGANPLTISLGFVDSGTALYSGGAAYSRSTSGGPWSLMTVFGGADAIFRTYVIPLQQPAPVPSLTTLGLAVLASLLGYTAWRTFRRYQ